jgi:hypothetical protein
MKYILTLSLLLNFAHASDHWDNCSTADGSIRTENGEIVFPEKNSEENYMIEKVLKVVNIKEEKETCTLEGTKEVVTSLDQTFSFEVYKMRIGESTFQAEFLCNRGGSGIPADANCDEKTAKKTVKYLVK